MNGYLFTAGLTLSEVRPTSGRRGEMVEMMQMWDTCVSAIVYGGEPEQAQKQFEAWCLRPREGERPPRVEIKKIVAAQFVDQLLTESGGQPLDWARLSQEIDDAVLATSVDDFEQGYWVDVNEALPRGKINSDVESLKRDLAEDFQSGLNWMPDKKFFFLVSVLSPYPTPAIPAYELESQARDGDTPVGENEAEAKPQLDEAIAALPEMRDKEAAALVRARNSVVAAWLWRKFGADTRLATNEIQIAPCCGFIPAE